MSYLLPCFAVDHLYLSCDEYPFSEEETAITDGNHFFVFILLLLEYVP